MKTNKKNISLFVLLTIIFVSFCFCVNFANAQETRRMFNVTKWAWEDVPVSQLEKFEGGVNDIGFHKTILNPVAAPGIIANLITGGIEKAAQGLMYILAVLASVIFWIGAQLIGLFMSLNMIIFDIPLVEVGWVIVRDVANLGFVLAIIIISVATIVRYKEYGAKQLLFRLIAAAILVNFSLVIAGVFIDFSHTLTNFFISKSSGDGSVFGMTTELATGFKTQKFLNYAQDENINLLQKAEKTLSAILSLAIAALFTFISAVSLLGIAIMLLTRFIYLSVLLIVSPIVYLFWVIPDTQSIWKSWWRKFFEWVFNAPILTSFLYLAVISIKKMGSFGDEYAAQAGSSIHSSLTLIPDVLIVIGQSLVMVGLVVGGLITANKMGITGADTAYKLASSAGKTTKKWALDKSKQGAKRAATAPFRSDKGRSVVENMETLGQNKGFFLRNLSSPFRAVGKAISKSSRSVEDRLQKEGKKLPTTLNDQARQYSTYSKPQKAQVLQNVGKEYETRSKNKMVADIEYQKNAEDLSNKQKGAEDLQKEVDALQKELEQYEKEPGFGMLASKTREKLAGAQERNKKAQEEIKEVRGNLKKAKDRKEKEDNNWKQFEQEVLNQLPNTAREEMEGVIKEGGGEFDVSKIKWARSFGYSDKTITPAKKRSQKIEDLIKDFLDEEKSGEKKEKEEKKEEKKDK